MAIKGLSKMVVATGYAYDPTKTGAAAVTYTDVGVEEKMIKYECTPNYADTDGLYADNGLAESAPQDFTDADITIGTDDLSQATTKKLYKVKETTETVGDKTLKVLAYDKDTEGQIIGLGLIEEHQYHNQTKYKGIILPKNKFDIKEDSAETRGSSISWQTPELSGKTMASDLYKDPTDSDDGYDNPWKLELEWTDTEKAALENILAWFEAHKKAGA